MTRDLETYYQGRRANARERETETNRLLSRQFGGDSAHLTGRNLCTLLDTVDELKGLVLTCAVELGVAIAPT